MNYTLLWALWIVAFVIIEGSALANAVAGDTLSEEIWRWFSVKDKSRAYKVKRTILVAFLAWLVVHFLGGGRFV